MLALTLLMTCLALSSAVDNQNIAVAEAASSSASGVIETPGADAAASDSNLNKRDLIKPHGRGISIGINLQQQQQGRGFYQQQQQQQQGRIFYQQQQQQQQQQGRGFHQQQQQQGRRSGGKRHHYRRPVSSSSWSSSESTERHRRGHNGRQSQQHHQGRAAFFSGPIKVYKSNKGDGKDDFYMDNGAAYGNGFAAS